MHVYGGTLTRSSLYQLSGAGRWDTRDAFDAVLAEAVREGRIVELGGVLLRASDD